MINTEQFTVFLFWLMLLAGLVAGYGVGYNRGYRAGRFDQGKRRLLDEKQSQYSKPEILRKIPPDKTKRRQKCLNE